MYIWICPNANCYDICLSLKADSFLISLLPPFLPISSVRLCNIIIQYIIREFWNLEIVQDKEVDCRRENIGQASAPCSSCIWNSTLMEKVWVPRTLYALISKSLRWGPPLLKITLSLCLLGQSLNSQGNLFSTVS